jgi:hypothetical protein
VAPFHPDVAAAQQKIQDLAQTAGCACRSAMGIAGSFELLRDEMQPPASHRLREIALAIELRSTWYLYSQLTQAKAGGGDLLGHPRNRSLLFFAFRCGALDGYGEI